MSETRHTTCVLDCPDACHLEVEVEEGRVTRIGGGRDHPDTAGFICEKVSRFDRRLYHRDRVLYPLRRVGPKGDGGFERLGWQEALDTIVENLRAIRDRWGGEAILPFHYGGSNGKLSDELLDDLFFAKLGASRLAKTICAVPTTEVARGMYGKMPGVAFEDFVHASAIVVWGANPKISNIHLVPYLRRAKQAGAFIAVVDPRRNFSEREIDLHLPVLPGQDLPVALAMIARWERQDRLDRAFLEQHADGLEPLLERARDWSLEEAARKAGVEAAAIARLAEVLAERSPAVIRCGWGIERNRNGAQAVAAVLAMPALLGKFGVRGGGYTLSNSGAVGFDREGVIGPLEWRTRSLNMTQLGRLLNGDLEPPIKALFVYNANPAATVPDQTAVLRGLAREDLFTVVHDQVLTDTARFADLVLPATTFLEAHDLRPGYGSYVVGGVRPVVEPGGESRSNVELFAALGRAMGWQDEAFLLDDEEIFRRAAAALELPDGGLDTERLAAGRTETYGFRGGCPVPFHNTFPRTPDGKIHLTPAILGPRPFHYLEPDDGYPLALVSAASGRLINSTLGETHVDILEATLHPRDAEARALSRGDRVRVFNRQGEVHCVLRISDRVRPGVAAMPKGAWRRSSLNGATATALCPDAAQVVGDAACFNDARVEVAKL